VLVYVVFLVAILSSVVAAQPYSIDLIAPWRKTEINVLVKEGPSYAVNATIRALEIWKKSFLYASETYSWASPLRNIKLIVYVEGLNDSLSSYDIVIDYVNAPSRGSELGLARFDFDKDKGVINRVEITLYLKYPGGYALMSYDDIYNVALHEIGHGLGLGHTDVNVTVNGYEVMYPYYLGKEKMTPSTLDLYGLVQVFTHSTYRDMPKKAVLPENIELRNILVYYVKVYTKHGSVRGYGRYIWGEVAVVELTDTKVYCKDVGYVFVRWEGTFYSSSPKLVFKVTGNVTLTAVWRPMYRVVVDDAGERREYWILGGEKLNLSLSRFIILSNFTRLRLVKVEPLVVNETEINVAVVRPMTLNVVRVPEYLVTVDTVLFGEKIYWVEKGDCFSPQVERDRLVFGNGTMMVFEGWTPSISECMRIVGPLQFVARWKKMYRVVLKGKTVYVEKGGVLRLNISPVVEELGEGVARGIYAWLVDGREAGGGEIVVEKPMVVEPVYRKSYLAGVCVIGYFGGSVGLNNTWIDNCSKEWLFEGRYVVRSVDGGILGDIYVDSPGTRYIITPMMLVLSAILLIVVLALTLYLRRRHG